jgi:hypothetical protein
MNRLVLHHTYANGFAFDVSLNKNHGYPILVSPGNGAFLSSFNFGQGGSRISVRSSASLQNLFSIRALVRFYLNPLGAWHRFNLMEGHLSFAMFVNPDASLQCTILDANSNWRGCISGPGIVAANRWHVATFEHDGVSQCRVLLDGALVAQEFDVQGPVRSIGDEGVAIGHWPGAPSAYTFEGNIGDVQLYKYDPRNDAKSLLDPCCIDRRKIDSLYLEAKQKGWDGNRLRKTGNELLAAVSQMAGEIRNGSPAETKQQKNIGAALLSGILRHDASAYRLAFQEAVTQAQNNLSSQDQIDHANAIAKIVQSLPFSLDEMQKFADILCLEHTRIDPKSLRHSHGRTGRRG